MSNIVKTVTSIFFVLGIFLAQNVFADHQPEFTALNPIILDNEIVQLRGEFIPQNSQATHSYESSEVWFEFGTDQNNLDFDTPRLRQSRLRTRIVEQGIADLEPNTIYYVEPVLRFNGETYRGDIVSFNSSDISPTLVDSSTSVEPTTNDSITGSLTSGRSIEELRNRKKLNSTSTTSLSSTSGLSLVSPSRFLPKSKTERDLEERERLVAARELALLEAQENARLSRTGLERSDFEESATNDRDNGEIIIAGNTKNLRTAGTASVFNAANASRNTGVNYISLFLFVVMLVGAVVLARITLQRKPRRYPAYARVSKNYRTPIYKKTQPQKRNPVMVKKYEHMDNNPAKYARFNYQNAVA